MKESGILSVRGIQDLSKDKQQEPPRPKGRKRGPEPRGDFVPISEAAREG